MRAALVFSGIAAVFVAAIVLYHSDGRAGGGPEGTATPVMSAAPFGAARPNAGSDGNVLPARPVLTPTAVSTADPTPVPKSTLGVTPVRVSLPNMGISANVVDGDVDPTINQMIPPNTPTDVAWYDYSALPGEGGNAVFAGHVDYHDYGPAVFWRLREARPGDLINVELSDGAVLTYRVEFTELYPAVGGPWQELFARDVGQDSITLYTCEGEFEAGEYDQRRVVRAVLVDSTDAPQQS